jgi:hypothetical protein
MSKQMTAKELVECRLRRLVKIKLDGGKIIQSTMLSKFIEAVEKK